MLLKYSWKFAYFGMQFVSMCINEFRCSRTCTSDNKESKFWRVGDRFQSSKHCTGMSFIAVCACALLFISILCPSTKLYAHTLVDLRYHIFSSSNYHITIPNALTRQFVSKSLNRICSKLERIAVAIGGRVDECM